MAYEKSLAGIQEITHPQRVLNARQRQVLILIDGKRSQDELEKSLNRLNVAEIVSDLERLGFIHDPAKPKAAFVPSQDRVELPEITPRQFTAVKSLMLDSTAEHLGLMGRPLVEQIKGVESHEQLRSCISRWHMALRESRNGHSLANDLMKQVQTALNAP
ncbi:hypothetical protein MTYP_00593 [Methylophilaceae bacterium]|nr:hypothetical protein MTYP_00593 [Methylophilaceae bacterium]